MVTGMVFPAYAVERTTLQPGDPITIAQTSSTAAPSSHDNIIYQNGNNPIPGAGFFIDNAIVADDFVLGASSDVTDAHFTFLCFDTLNCPNIEPLAYFILADNAGQPGAVIDSGTAQNVQVRFWNNIKT